MDPMVFRAFVKTALALQGLLAFMRAFHAERDKMIEEFQTNH